MQEENKFELKEERHVKIVEVEESKEKDDTESAILFKVKDNPPWLQCFVFGLQHFLVMFTATLTIPFTLAPALCVGDDNNVKAELISTIVFVSGIITLVQVALGVRLPVVQAGTFALMVPSLAILSLPKWRCPTVVSPETAVNLTDTSNIVTRGTPAYTEMWQSRLREIQGAIMVASTFEILLGFTGLVGLVLRFFGPLVISPTVSILGLALFNTASNLASKQWWIAILTAVLIVIFAQYMKNILFPCPSFKRKKGCYISWYPVFQAFPVLLAMVITWLICGILTATNVFPKTPGHWGYEARTDTKMDVLNNADWIRLPYPGQWGRPTVSISSVIGIIAGLLASAVESVGDYYACARISGAPPPPSHAVNRGIGIEGLGCLIAGAFGTGNGTTSTTVNIGAIGVTKCGSRRVIYYAAGYMLVLGLLGKFGALFVAIPDPVIGGIFLVLFGMITAVGVSSLQYVNLNSSRNLCVIGLSFFIGLTVPQWIKANPSSIHTGVQTVDNVFYVLLSTNNFLAGLVGFILDNTLPGTDKERGIEMWTSKLSSTSPQSKETAEIYDIPFISNWLAKKRLFHYLPFCPAFRRTVLDAQSTPSMEELTENELQNGIKPYTISNMAKPDGEAVCQL
ncbi:unnamed protein product [Owenia fusiformis]|uniref:Solute carrier family 23 member 2 n=1 Tax=Owenia fusiformis TaxID=6347 RepID=A0A8S4P3B6_OWEFU|nr:unnamed protein product [Owenia fusiformis]